MSKALVVAEKPSVARDIAAALGGFEDHESHLESEHFVVSWAIGHLLELKEPEEIDPKYKRWLLEDLPILPAVFEWRPKEGQSDRIRALGRLAKRNDVTKVINACDAGREGELIFRELMLHLQCQKPNWRLWLQSMTREAIREGFQHLRPGSEYDGLGDAAFCRSEADWLIGMNATRALTRRMKTRTETTAWSAGRVQTPTLALLVEREIEVLTHRPEPYWRIQAQFQAPSHAYQGTWFNPKFQSEPDSPRKDDWIIDAKELERILKAVEGQSGSAEETRKPRRESAPALFDLTSLQREANRKFGFSARRTLQAAQRLYEQHKALTYPRTDSRCLPNDYRDHVKTVLGKFSQGGSYASPAQYLRNNGLQNEKRVFDDSKVSDHFAIIPTEVQPGPDLSGDDLRVYDLVVRRFLAAFYPPAVWIEVERITQVASEHFRTRSRYLSDPGWYEVYGKEGEDTKLPALGQLSADVEKQLVDSLRGISASVEMPLEAPAGSKGVPVRTLEIHSEAEQTKPPARITEARLLSLMEHAGQQVKDDEALSEAMKGKGLGTPATRAEIIENLISKQYARRAERVLRATSKGILLIDLLKRIQVDRLASARLTGELEKHLQEVEMGARKRTQFMEEVFNDVRGIVEKAKTFSYDQLYVNEPPLGQCPRCKQAQVFEQSRFYACQRNTGKDSPCTLIVWKERSGRYVDRVTVSELLRDGATALLEGFLTSSGRGYAARLKFDEEFQLETLSEGGDGPGGDNTIDPSAAPLAPCPLMPEGCRVFETASAFRCENHCVADIPKRKVGVVLPKLVCQREIQVEEALAYFTQGTTAEISDFISRFGRPFTARLVMQPNGRHSFEFPPREGKTREKTEKKGPEKKTKTTKAAKTTKAKATKTKTKAAPKKPAAKKAAPKKAAPKAKKAVKEPVEGKPKAAPKVRLVKP